MSGKKFEPTDYDVLIGRMLTTTRMRFGLSQKDIAKSAGITFQQVQKYERAGNRLSVSRLHQIVSQCFNGMTVGTFLNEASQPYNRDAQLTQIVRALYNMNPDGIKLVAQLVSIIAQNYPK